MEKCKNMIAKLIRCFKGVLSFLDEEGKNGWGVRGGIGVMMDSREKVAKRKYPIDRRIL